MEAYLCVYSLKELKQIYKINIGSFPTQMLILQNKFILFRNKQNKTKCVDIRTSVTDVITSDLEMNIKRTYINSYKKE